MNFVLKAEFTLFFENVDNGLVENLLLSDPLRGQ